jgi:hypothetical protein
VARLPVSGSDEGQWGDVLNDFLMQSHNGDGTLKSGVVNNAQIAIGAISGSAIANGSITATKIQNNSLTAAQIADGTITNAKLAPDAGGSTTGIRSLLIFYAPPNIINAQYNNDYAAGALARYDDVVLGGGLENPADTYYSTTQSIIQKLAILSPSTVIWGYIDAGVTTSNLSLPTIQTQIDQWITLGAKGIFLDTFGYDYHTSRSRQNSILSYVHSKGYGAIMNAWNADDALAPTVDATYNPSGTPTVANSTDVLLLESWICNSTSYASPYFTIISDVKTRGDKALAYRASLGIRIFAANIIVHTGTSESTLQNYYDMSEGLARTWRLDGSGVNAASYSSNGIDVGVVTPRFSSYRSTPLRPTAPYILNGSWTQVQAPDLGITISYNPTGPAYTWQQL